RNVDASRPRKLGSEHRGNIGRTQHSVRNAPPEGGFLGIGFVKMDRIEVAANLREGAKGIAADGVDEACLHADLKVLEKVPRTYRGGRNVHYSSYATPATPNAAETGKSLTRFFG